MNLEALRFPVGKFSYPSQYNEADKQRFMETLEQLPSKLKGLCHNLSAEALSYIYRPDGWNIAQVVHHISDSHMNAFCRFKLALTEDNPTIKPYHEDRWVNLADTGMDNVADALGIITHVHAKLVRLCKGMSASDFDRTYFHPESQKTQSLYGVLALYDWHSRHHLAHIEQALQHKGSF